MSKRALRIPAGREGQGVRWTLEVSADAVKKPAHAPKASMKQAASKGRKKPPAAERIAEAKKRTASTTHRKAASRPKAPSSNNVAPRVEMTPPPLPVPPSSVSPTVVPTELAASTTKLVSRPGGTPLRRAIVVAATGVLVVSIVAVTGYPSRNAPPSPPESQPETLAAPVRATPVQPVVPSTPPADPAPIPSTSVTRPAPIVPEPTRQTRLVASHVGEPADATPRSSAPASVAAAAMTEPREPAAKPAVAEPASSAPAAHANDAVDAGQPPVTITGCLETSVDEDRFRLTDTEGAGAPKARGWRSGFLKKHSADVDLVHLSDVAALKKLVGRRVAATGRLNNRELSLTSVEASGRGCD